MRPTTKDLKSNLAQLRARLAAAPDDSDSDEDPDAKKLRKDLEAKNKKLAEDSSSYESYSTDYSTDDETPREETPRLVRKLEAEARRK